MDSSDATRFLHARAFCIATAVAAATVGELGRGSLPILHAFVASEVNVPTARKIPHNASFDQLLDTLRTIDFRPFNSQNNDSSNGSGRSSTAFSLLAPMLASSPTAQKSDLAQFVATVAQKAGDSPHALALLIDLIEPQLAPPHAVYELESLLVSFLRKTLVALHSLTFEALARLSNELCNYIHADGRRSGSEERSSLPSAAVMSSAITSLMNGPSSQPLDVMVPSASSLPSYLTPFPHTTASDAFSPHPYPHPLTESPDALVSITGEYVRHLEALRRKDVTVSLDSLHRYFDRTLSFLPRPSSTASSTIFPFPDLSTPQSQQQQQPNQLASSANPHTHQYAALSLAIAHARLGGRDLASAALNDVVRAAHASADRACHVRSLSWIAHVEGNPARRHLLLAHLGDPLALARECVTAVFTPLSDAVPHAQSPLTTRSSSNTNMGPVSRTPTAAQRMWAVLGVCVPVSDRRVTKLLLTAASWSSFGDGASALASAKLALSVATAEAFGRVTTERVQAVSAVASLLAEFQGDHSGALALLASTAEEARSQNEQSKHNDFSCANQGGNATSLGENGPANVSPELDTLSQTAAWISFGLAERHGDARAAEKALRSLEAAAHWAGDTSTTSGRAMDTDGRADALLDVLEAQTRLALLTSDFSTAARSAYNLCRKAARAVRPERAVKALILASRAFLAARAPSSALHTALAAVSLAQGFGLEIARGHSVCILALCMAGLSSEPQAPDISERLEPIGDGNDNCDKTDLALRATDLVDGLLTCGMNGCSGGRIKTGRGSGNDTIADILQTRAQCAMVLAATRELRPDFNIVLLLRRAMKMYIRSSNLRGVSRCWYLLARVHHARGERNARNAAAKRFNATVREARRKEIGLSTDRHQ